MRNKHFILGLLAMIAGIVLVLSSCSSVPRSAEMNYDNWGAFGEVFIPAKDFETRGLVFTEVQFQISEKQEIAGETFTYQALLKEAAKLGADAIINVTIDKRAENVSVGMRTVKQETWYGSALAIKYTNMLSTESLSRTRVWSTTGGVAATNEAQLQSSSGGGLLGIGK